MNATRSTKIPGLIQISLQVFGDNRGWFKENFRKDQLVQLGLPADFTVVQNNVSYNESEGVTRGIHAEPWDKYISVANGCAFVAFVDLRAGENFGTVDTFEIEPDSAIFLPRGVGNSFQTLEPNTIYTYLVNGYWSDQITYTMVNLADPTLAIEWPIPLAQAIVSEKDQQHPLLIDVSPVGV